MYDAIAVGFGTQDALVIESDKPIPHTTQSPLALRVSLEEAQAAAQAHVAESGGRVVQARDYA